MERERFLDMHDRIVPAHQKVLLMIAVLLAPTAPWQPKLAPVPLLLALVGYAWAQHNATRYERPELVIAGGLVWGQLMLAATVVVADLQHGVGLAILAWPLVAAGGRFPTRVVMVGTAFTVGLMLAASLGFHGERVVENPIVLTLPIATLLAITAMSRVVRESDIVHRNAAVLDGLTGMLNRTALAARTAEIEHQARVTGEPISVVLIDIDHFKSVNDTHGHTAGDAVLRDVAYRLRKELRAFDLAYRLGGEEFAVILLGSEEAHGVELAERLRRAIGDQPIGGLQITISLGVAAAAGPEEPFSWQDAYHRADAALYLAKQTGRNRVCRASEVSDGDRSSAAPGQRRLRVVA
jgi:diguanylate cyclase (GGDEF)-like protein